MRPNYVNLERYRWRGTYPPKDEYSLCRAVSALFSGAAALLATCRRRGRDRRELARLDYRMRRDIGVTPSDVAGECAKPFWRG